MFLNATIQISIDKGVRYLNTFEDLGQKGEDTFLFKVLRYLMGFAKYLHRFGI